jgi:hypothetical protein
MAPAVYIETTIPSYYFETRTTPQAITWRHATRTWWDRFRGSYTLVTSSLVIEELALAPPEKAGPGRQLLAGCSMLEPDAGVGRAAEAYLRHKLVPRNALADAVHLALASVHGVDFLLTWNCRHLANANKVRHLTIINRRLGISTPILTTPLTLLPE